MNNLEIVSFAYQNRVIFLSLNLLLTAFVFFVALFGKREAVPFDRLIIKKL